MEGIMKNTRPLARDFLRIVILIILILLIAGPVGSGLTQDVAPDDQPEKRGKSSLAPDASQLYLQDTFDIADSASWEETPAIAMCDTYDKPLVVFEKGGDIYGQRLLKSDGSLDGSAFLISDGTGMSSYPDVACAHLYNQYLVVWTYNEVGGDDEVYGRLVYGQRQSGSQLLGSQLNISYHVLDNVKPTVACNGSASNCMVSYNAGTFDPGTGLLSQRVRLTGSNIEKQGDWFNIETEDVVDTDIAWGAEDGTYMLVYSFYDSDEGIMRIKYSLIHDLHQTSGSQELYEPPYFLLGTDDAPFNQNYPQVAATAKSGAFMRYLVVYEYDLNTAGSLSWISAVYHKGNVASRSADIFPVFEGYNNYDRPRIAYSGGASGISGGYFPDDYLITGMYSSGTERSVYARAFTGDYVYGSGPEGNALLVDGSPNTVVFDIDPPGIVGSLNNGKYTLAYEWLSKGFAPDGDIQGAMVYPDCFNLTTNTIPDCPGCGVSSDAFNCDSTKIAYGTETEVFAWETNDYNFWYWGGAASGTDRASTFIMDSDKSVTAYFHSKAQVLFDEAHNEINTINWSRAQELSDTLPWNPDPEWVYFGDLADEMWEDFNFERNVDQELTINLLNNYNVLILSVPWDSLSASEAAAIKQHVKNGGGLIMLGDSSWDSSTLMGLDTYYGMSFDPHGIFDLNINNPTQDGDFQITNFADQAPTDNLTSWGTNWGQSLTTSGNATPLGFTDTSTWQDTNYNDVYDPGIDQTGAFTMIASYDQGCGRVLAVADNSFQDANFEWYNGDELMYEALTWMLGGQYCGEKVYMPMVVRDP
jgi:hypothetical protein